MNGSKTQSATTTESNTPENTVRLDNMSHKQSHNYHIENNEVVLERKHKFTYFVDLLLFYFIDYDK